MSSEVVDTFSPFLCQNIITLSPVTEHSSISDSLPVCIKMFWLLGDSTIDGRAIIISYVSDIYKYDEKYLEEVRWVSE